MEDNGPDLQPIELENSICAPMDNSSSDYFGKNRFRWSSRPPVSSRSIIIQYNTILQPSGLKCDSQGVLHENTKPIDLWRLFFTEKMFEEIKHTNGKKSEKCDPIIKGKQRGDDLEIMKLKDFIGILYYTAIFKENHTPSTCLYNKDDTGT